MNNKKILAAVLSLAFAISPVFAFASDQAQTDDSFFFDDDDGISDMNNTSGISAQQRENNDRDRINPRDDRNPGDFRRGDDRDDRQDRGDRRDRDRDRFRGGRFPHERGGRFFHGGRYYQPHRFLFRGYREFPFSSGSYLYFDPDYFTGRFFRTCFPGGYFNTANPYCLNLFWQGWKSGQVNAWNNNKWYNPW